MNDIISRLAAVDGGLRAVIPDGNGGFIDLTGIRTDDIAVEARSEGDAPGNRHGPKTEATGHDPLELVAIIGGIPVVSQGD